MSRPFIRTIITAFALLACTPVIQASAEELRIGAGAAPTENILKPIKAAFEKASGLTLSTISNGPKQAFVELDKGTVDAASAGLAIDDWWALLKKEGGKDLPILVVWGNLIPGTNSMFSKVALGGAVVTKDVLEATTAEDVKEKVKANQEAVGIGPAALVDDSVHSPKTAEVARAITLMTKGAPSAKVKKLLDFIKGDGARLVK